MVRETTICDSKGFLLLLTSVAMFGACTSASTGAPAGSDGTAGDASTTNAGGASGGFAAGAGGSVAGSGGQIATGGTTTDAAVGGVTGGSGGSVVADGGAGGEGGAPPQGPIEGTVHVVKRMGDPTFDSVVTNPSPTTVQWLSEHFYRMEVFTTFFDDKTSFYDDGWVYSDSQVIYPGSSTATAHPDWILKDSGGKSVYLDWGCSGGACPQYAADVTSAAFRADWIASLNATLTKGYRGAWIDDVNLELRFSDGTNSTTAYSSATHAAITSDAWAEAVSAFMSEIRAKVPGYELLHNSIWYARPGRTDDAYVKAEIAAADVVNVEGGFASDGGLVGGTGEWSVFAKMAFIDAVHAAKRWVVVDDFPSTDSERQYALACYLLVTNGNDGLGDASMSPSSWWKGYDVRLGRALGARTRDASGLFRREFERGVVLMLEPSAASRQISLPATYVTIDGVDVTSVDLTAKHGAVLVAK